MPFSQNFDAVYQDGIQLAARFIKNYDLNWIRLDEEAYKQRVIEENVLRNIDNSDLLIADISRYPDKDIPNVSVMHEIGYACGRDIPFILIGQEGTHKNLPSNLKGSILVMYKSDSEAALKDFSRRLGKQITKIIKDEVLPRLRGGFQVEGFSARRNINISNLIERANQHVRILTTNLSYTSLFLKDAISRALSNNTDNPAFKVEILAMDPESDVANWRARQLGEPSTRKYRDLLRKSLDDMRDTFGDYPNVDITTYSSLPTQMTFIVDNTVIIAVVSLGLQSREGIHFVMKSITREAAPFVNHFVLLKQAAVQQS